eukprot:CAMPEP_0184300844 /NCGR_PEP_ID=MMETSP1049-20130417/11184_1 /TAXON_ID=77928 /ORGANISM="Proteomonas sulcata, Strain CCMP704" /LENGTH=50 /DNA_ID=CAMNT_0026611679 /DNA_START=1202 /DNA_END=1350 /DNA_ORIENTATION=-
MLDILRRILAWLMDEIVRQTDTANDLSFAANAIRPLIFADDLVENWRFAV